MKIKTQKLKEAVHGMKKNYPEKLMTEGYERAISDFLEMITRLEIQDKYKKEQKLLTIWQSIVKQEGRGEY